MAVILAVDDDEKNLKLIKGFLAKEDYEILTAKDGQEAYDILTGERGKEIELLLTDRMMPNMDGIELSKRLKKNKELKNIPIIMQTAAAQVEQVAEGIDLGVYYYLTKPFDAAVLQALVRAAIEEYARINFLSEEATKYDRILQLVDTCNLVFRSMSEAKGLTSFLANLFPSPESVTFGIHEMLVNAVEHGNLGIGYEGKSKLFKEGTWDEEIARREALKENRKKKVRVSFERDAKIARLSIEDDGDGFDWERYLKFDAARATHTHGRGIALSNEMSFDSIEYCGKGNKVICSVLL